MHIKTKYCFYLQVKHVINYDCPTSVSDYILRAGRVGRVGTNQGYVTNLVSTKAEVYAVQEIEVCLCIFFLNG